MRVTTPCLITTIKELNEARYMSVGGIYDAYNSKEVEVWNLNNIHVDMENIELKGSPTKVKKSFTKGAKTAGKVFVVDAKEAAEIIVDKLKEKYMI